MSLSERIAAAKAQQTEKSSLGKRISGEKEKQAWRAESLANIASESYDPTEGMSTGEKLLAGAGSGLTGIAQSVGNMVGLVEDETIAERKRLDAPLSDTTAGSVGQFAGEMAALAPLGAVGMGAKALQAGGKVLPTALRALTSKPGVAALEGAGAGAVLADPNERGAGAATGAGAGVLLNRALAGLSRVGKDGLVKQTPSAAALKDLVEKRTGKRPFIPLAQAADAGADSLSAKGRSFADTVSLLPSARAAMEKQTKELGQDSYNMLLRSSFQGKKSGPMASKVLEETGDVEKAIDAARATLKGKGPLTKTQQALSGAAQGKARGQFTPRQLISSSAKTGRQFGTPAGSSPLRYEATLMEDVLGEAIGTSTVASRDAYHRMSSMLDFFGGTIDTIPGLGKLLSSKNVQQSLLGDTKLQNSLREALASGNGQRIRAIMSRIRATTSGQPALNDESSDLQSYADQLRGEL